MPQDSRDAMNEKVLMSAVMAAVEAEQDCTFSLWMKVMLGQKMEQVHGTCF